MKYKAYAVMVFLVLALLSGNGYVQAAGDYTGYWYGKPLNVSGKATTLASDNNMSTYVDTIGAGNLLSMTNINVKATAINVAYVTETGAYASLITLRYTDGTYTELRELYNTNWAMREISIKVNSDKVLSSVTFNPTGGYKMRMYEIALIEVPTPTIPASEFAINNLAVSGDWKSAKITWNTVNSDFFSKYNIYQNGALVQTITTKTTNTYSFTNLTQSTDYTYSVSATDSYNREYAKSTVNYSTGKRPPPPAPTLTGSVDDGTVTLSFTTNSTVIKKYVLYQDGKQIAEVVGNSYTIKGMKNDQPYVFTVTAVDDAGVSSDASAALTLTPKVRVVQKPGLSVESGDGQVKLSYNTDSPYIVGYRIYQDGKQIAEKGVNENQYTVTGLKNGVVYMYYVVGIDDRGNVSDPSATVKGVPTQRVLPDTNSGQVVKDDYLLVTWQASKDAVGYLIYLNGTQVGKVGASVSEYRITKAMGYNPNGLSNRSEVRAVYADGAIGGNNNVDAPKTTIDEKSVGIGGSSVWVESMKIVFAMSGFLLLGILIRFAPRMINLVRRAAVGRMR